ncbi:MAG: UDP-N-acetylmuramoyl-L-alanine--D-glutamate ligase [bacterium]|nr:UDP-N-acetylmuramoyl-L-alanine--D-glutamate ligase [bacterium]
MNAIMQKLKGQYKGKNVLVVGLGLQGGGSGVVEFFAKLGAHVIVQDKKSEEILKPSIEKLKLYDITFHLGTDHNIDDFLKANLIMIGPSVKWNLPGIIEAEKKGIPVEMEMSFFAEHCPAKIIGITGTRGKSTTTNMIYKLLKDNGLNTYLAGNIPGQSTISLLEKIQQNDWVVMELASWPLAAFNRKNISPHIAVFTNFYPDHLNYYASMNEYAKDKKAIYLHQKKEDYLIINKSLESFVQHDVIKSTVHYFSKNDWKSEFEFIHGDHNKENAAAALKVAEVLQLNKQKSIRSIASFKGLPYRQEIVGKKENVVFVNDTTSTTPTSVLIALDSFIKLGKIYLILGGTSKKLPYDEMMIHLSDVEKIILLGGSFTDEILKELTNRYPEKVTQVFFNLNDAIEHAYTFAKITGGYVIFSPGAPSFAMFNNEFHRGDEYNKIVNQIIQK